MSVMSDEDILNEITAIVTGNRVALFMKGTPEEPRCGFSARVAERILEYRAKNSGFKKIEELMNVKGIGEKSFLKIKPLIQVAKPDKASGGD